MERRIRRNEQPLKQISLIRTPPEIIGWSEEEIAEFHVSLVDLPSSEEKDRALRRFDFFIQQRQKMLNRYGGKLPFLN